MDEGAAFLLSSLCHEPLLLPGGSATSLYIHFYGVSEEEEYLLPFVMAKGTSLLT